MAQEYIKINGVKIRQPDEDMGYDFETIFSEDTKRTQAGTLMTSPAFTVESLSYQASNVTVEEMRTILRQIMKGGFFTLHYWSPYYGAWRDDQFYVGRGSLVLGRLNEAKERYTSLSFNMVGRNAVT
jgi:hypothetical protein